MVNAAASHIPRSDRCVPKYLGIVFTRHTYRGSVCKTELLKWQTSSVLLIYFALPFQRSCSILQFLGQDTFYDTASPCQTSSCITEFHRIFLISGEINGILRNKCLLLCINLGRKALPPSVILKVARFRNLNLLKTTAQSQQESQKTRARLVLF